MIGLILGNIMVVLGVFSIIKGKLPLIKRYNGVKNIKLHSRIEGTAIWKSSYFGRLWFWSRTFMGDDSFSYR